MKSFLGILFLIAFTATADEIRVSRMMKDGPLERSFVLKTNIQNKVVIDCQSFIQGLRIGEYEQAINYLLDPEECEGLQTRIRSSLRKGHFHCIDLDQDIRSDRSCI
jgi:hypothetical protein